MTSGRLLAFGFAACALSHAGAQRSQRLSAPTYYIAASAQLEYGSTVRVRGISNLPPGAVLSLEVFPPAGIVWTDGGRPVCVPIDGNGLFKQEIAVPARLPRPNGLYVRATFQANLCNQHAQVLQIVGRHGEFLGNDDHHVTMEEVENGWTHGMNKNPQLFQVSGWYFGISDIAQVEGWR
jgi:hypothetical protein